MQTPRHVAIIMDGNGRWARARGLPRSAGHKAGVTRLKDIIWHAAQLKLPYLTLFAFSSENWNRPETEISYLLELIEFFIKRYLKRIHEKNIRVRVIGRRENISHSLRTLIDEAENLTKDNHGLCLNVAFNYGSRDEILRAVQEIIPQAIDGKLMFNELSPEMFSTYLDTHDMPDPDLVIRTGGELRLSNFLLWQVAYSEFYFTENYWPDFSLKEFDNCFSLSNLS